MEKEIEIRAKENDSYKLILKLKLNEEDEELLKKKKIQPTCVITKIK